MRDTLIHRGPDDEGVYLNESKNVALGHRRLSIIDLSPLGKQPMKNENGTIWITFNGEIYNFQEIREELLELNHIFYSKTDTEVILHGYEEWGLKVLDKLRGMFAFGIWDENKHQLFLARDRIGVKPLYYYYNGQRFIFASELKAIIKDNDIERKINPEGLKNFFLKGYIPAPYTIWENIYKLPPGHYLIFKENNFLIKKYWSLEVKELKANHEQIINNIKQILIDAINIRFISDVPVGILLSGGIDSSLVAALGSKLKKNLLTFSIGFQPDEFSELKYAKKVAEHLNIKNLDAILTQMNVNDYLEEILYYYDEPLGVSSIFPTFLLMKVVSKELKVVLSGDGGDEVFAGYIWYEKNEKYRRYNRLIPLTNFLYNINLRVKKYLDNRITNFLNRHLKLLRLNNFERYCAIGDNYFTFNEVKKLFDENILKKLSNEDFLRKYFNTKLNNIKDSMILDINTFLVDHVLVKVDRASMANSIEVRIPYIDHLLLEFVMSIDHKLIYKNKQTKYILKKIAEPLLPKVILKKPKQGFSAPLDSLNFLKKNILVLNNPLSVKDKILNGSYIKKLLKSPSKLILERKLWLLILFELWYRKWKGSF